MAKVTFYFVRHGETEFNRDGLVQGWSNAALTDEGVRVARVLGRGFARAKLPFVAAYSSDLGRAIQTLDEILDARAQEDPQLAPPQWRMGDKRLREWGYGSFETRPGTEMRDAFNAAFGREMSFAELNECLPQVSRVLVCADTTGKAETWDEIVLRLRSFLRDVTSEVRAAGGGNVLAVSHSFAIRTLLYLLNPEGHHHARKVENGSVTVISANEDGFVLESAASTEWLA